MFKNLWSHIPGTTPRIVQPAVTVAAPEKKSTIERNNQDSCVINMDPIVDEQQRRREVESQITDIAAVTSINVETKDKDTPISDAAENATYELPGYEKHLETVSAMLTHEKWGEKIEALLKNTKTDSTELFDLIPDVAEQGWIEEDPFVLTVGREEAIKRLILQAEGYLYDLAHIDFSSENPQLPKPRAILVHDGENNTYGIGKSTLLDTSLKAYLRKRCEEEGIESPVVWLERNGQQVTAKVGRKNDYIKQELLAKFIDKLSVLPNTVFSFLKLSLLAGTFQSVMQYMNKELNFVESYFRRNVEFIVGKQMPGEEVVGLLNIYKEPDDFLFYWNTKSRGISEDGYELFCHNNYKGLYEAHEDARLEKSSEQEDFNQMLLNFLYIALMSAAMLKLIKYNKDHSTYFASVPERLGKANLNPMDASQTIEGSICTEDLLGKKTAAKLPQQRYVASSNGLNYLEETNFGMLFFENADKLSESVQQQLASVITKGEFKLAGELEVPYGGFIAMTTNKVDELISEVSSRVEKIKLKVLLDYEGLKTDQQLLVLLKHHIKETGRKWSDAALSCFLDKIRDKQKNKALILRAFFSSILPIINQQGKEEDIISPKNVETAFSEFLDQRENEEQSTWINKLLAELHPEATEQSINSSEEGNSSHA